MKKNFILIVMMSVVFLIILFMPKQSESVMSDSDRLSIYSNNYAVSLLVEEIGKDQVEVKNIYPKDADVHSYEISSKQLSDIASSDIVYYISKEEDKEIYNLSLGDEDTMYVGLSDDNYFKENVASDLYIDDMIVNDHIWISPKNLNIISDIITNNLIEVDSVNADYYTSNNLEVSNKLESIDNEYSEFGTSLTSPLLISHDSLFFLEHDYGIEYYGIMGEHHDDEPTSKEMADYIDYASSGEIKSILYEQNDEQNELMNQIQVESGIDSRVFNNLSVQSGNEKFDNMDIFELLEYNLETMKECVL